MTAPLRGSHGLSARRERRTKSSRPEGPNAGPNLEVGPRRGPRLLVPYNGINLAITSKLFFNVLKNQFVEGFPDSNSARVATFNILGTNAIDR